GAGSLGGGEADREAAAAARAAVNLQRTAVGHDDRAGDGQTEPAAARVAVSSFVEPHEGLEDAPGVGRVDPDPGVLDDERHTVARLLERDRHAAAGRRVLDRVVD